MLVRSAVAIVVAVAAVLGGSAGSRPAWGSPDELDSSFGNAGVVLVPVGPGAVADSLGSLAMQGSRIIAAGGTSAPDAALGLAALSVANGLLDAGFGTGGIVTTPFSNVGGDKVVLQRKPPNQGKLVVLGRCCGHGFVAMHTVLARYDPDGGLDDSFGGDAFVEIGEGENDAVVQGDDRIVVAATQTAFAFTASRIVVTRLLPDGLPDPAFGSGGAVQTDPVPGTFNSARAVKIQADGKIVVAGGGGAGQRLLIRYDDVHGSLDDSFGTMGIVLLPGAGVAADLALVDGGGLVTAGGNTLTKHDASGALDPTFGSGGITAPLAGATFSAIVTGESGAIAATEPITVAGQMSSRFLVARYAANGTLDTTFGVGGVLTVPVGTEVSQATSVARQSDGRLVIGGSGTGPDGTLDFAVIRLGDAPACGDGVLGAGEECDDGNQLPGDCCSPGCTYEPAGNPCADEGVSCSVDACDGSGSCSHTPDDSACPTCEGCEPVTGCVARPRPASECRHPMRAWASELKLRDSAVDSGDRFDWKWRKGDATAAEELGNPLATSSFAVCIFDQSSAEPSLLFRAEAPAGGLCASRPCWKGTGSPAGSSGYRYSDRSGGAGGLRRMVLKPGLAGHAEVSASGRGLGLEMPGENPHPPLPVPGPVAVRVQLLGNDRCWEASFSAAGVRRNRSTSFVARSDP